MRSLSHILYGIAIAIYVRFTFQNKMSFLEFVKTMWGLELIFIGIGTYTLLGFRNIRRCFIKSYRKSKPGMHVDEVKNIMRCY